MTIPEKKEAIVKLCMPRVCYSCNFSRICSQISSLDELNEDALNKMIENGNKPGAGALFLTKDGIVTNKYPGKPLGVTE